MIIPDLLDLPAKQARFSRIALSAMHENREDLRDGIGLLGEKWQHQIIKRYLSENAEEHEVKLDGTRYVSDVRVGDTVYEVQTGSFGPMKKKLECYFANPSFSVQIVHPLPAVRYLSYMDAKTGEISPSHRVAGKNSPKLLLPELYPLLSLLPYVAEGRLSFRLLLLEVKDFRLQASGKSRRRASHTEKLERIPTGLVDEIVFSSPADFRTLIPDEFPNPMTVAEFSKRTGFRGIDAYSAVRALTALGIFSEAGQKGNAMAFRFNGE